MRSPETARSRRRASASEPTLYDFTRPIQLSREHVRLLELAAESFAGQATTVFTSALRSICEVSLASITQRAYGEYIDSLGPETLMVVFTAEPLTGGAILQLEPAVVMNCIDHMLGGPGGETQPERPLTEIETTVWRVLLDRLLGELRYSMASVLDLHAVFDRLEYTPHMAQLAGGADAMVVLEFTVTIDERPSQLTLCLPFDSLHPFLLKAAAPVAVSAEERARRSRSAARRRRTFSDVPVDVVVRFRPAHMTPEELTALVPGDVIRLPHPAAAPLDVCSGTQLFARASAGVQGAKLAALIIDAEPKETD